MEGAEESAANLSVTTLRGDQKQEVNAMQKTFLGSGVSKSHFHLWALKWAYGNCSKKRLLHGMPNLRCGDCRLSRPFRFGNRAYVKDFYVVGCTPFSG